MPDFALPLSCARLLPHRAPMLLAGELIEVGPGYARVRAGIGPGNPFLGDNGVLDPVAAVELTAQAIAALRGFEAVARGEPVHIGYLVGIKDFAIDAQARAGDELEAEVRQEFAMEQAALMTAEVRRGTERLGGGTIKIWEESEWPSAPGRAKESGKDESGSTAKVEGRLAGGEVEATLGKSGLLTPMARAIAAACEGFEAGAGEPSIVGYFYFDKDFLGFRGHFPGFPILPAVLMPRLVLLTAGEAWGKPLALRRIGHAKIGQGVFPGDRLRVEVTMENEAAGAIVLKARLIGPRGVVGNFVLECGG